LGIRFAHLEEASGVIPRGSSDIIRRFVRADRSGFYLEVLQTGRLTAGEDIELTHAASGKTIRQIYRERLKNAV